MPQTNLAHHPDCDGFRTAHRVTIERDGTLRRAVCAECGPLHVGLFGPAVPVERMFSDHASEVPCDGRCRDWS